MGRVVAFAPGRANLIGEHTDYNQGLSLPFAIAQGVTVVAQTATGRCVAVQTRDRGSERFPVPVRGHERRGDWRDLVRGTIAELAEAGIEVPGARLEIKSDLPEGQGLSSSAALSVALCLALRGLAGAGPTDPVSVAHLCSRVENEWVGARTGLLDQLASLLGRPGQGVLIDFRTLFTKAVPLRLGQWRLICVGSGESRSLVKSGYNQRRHECDQARQALGLASLRDAELSELDRLPDALRRRVRHVVEENQRVWDMAEALEGQDLPAAGRLLDASHASLRDLYDASTPAVEETVARLRTAGAAGARMMGAGFGGAVLALMPPGRPDPPDGIELVPSGGASLLEA